MMNLITQAALPVTLMANTRVTNLGQAMGVTGKNLAIWARERAL